MRSRLTSNSGPSPPDVTTTDVADPVSCDSEGSISDSPMPSPMRPNSPHKLNGVDTMDSGSVTGIASHLGAYAVQRIHFGSFYLRMGAVGKIILPHVEGLIKIHMP